MSKRISRAQRARNLINKGYTNKYIFEHFPYIPKQTVYSERWKINKKKGLASLPKPEPVATGTGITSAAPLTFEIIDHPNDKRVVKASNNRRKGQLKRWERERAERERRGLMDAANQRPWANPNGISQYKGLIQVSPPPKPTMWQRIKAFFGA